MSTLYNPSAAATAETVALMLSELPRTVAQPVRVTIGRTVYVGAIYAQQRDHMPGARAYADDGARTYYMGGLYLLGELPPSYRHRHARAYFDADGARWYVAGYVTAETAADPRYADCHPCGAHFLLMPDRLGVTLTGVYDQPVTDRTMGLTVELLPALGVPVETVEHVSQRPVSGTVERLHGAGLYLRTDDGRSVYADASDGWTVELLPELRAQLGEV